MNVDKLKAQFCHNNERAEASIKHCLNSSTCSPEQKAYIQQIAQGIFSEILEMQQFLIEQAEGTSR